MIGKRKPFEKLEYNQCNNRAIEIIKKYLISKGYTVNNKEKEDKLVDITAIKGTRISFHEVEIKKCWIDNWPLEWSTIQIPERKSKYNTNQHFIWILSCDMSKAWLVKGTDLQDKYLKEIHNKKIRCGEYFFCVPLKLATKVNL